jgi:hypothetical protein
VVQVGLQDLAEVLVQVVVVGLQVLAEVLDLQELVEPQGLVEQVVEVLPHLIMWFKDTWRLIKQFLQILIR